MSKTTQTNELNQSVFSKEDLTDEIAQLQYKLEHFDDMTLNVSIKNDENGNRKGSILLSHYNLEDIVQVMVVLNALILEDENRHIIADTLLDLALAIMSTMATKEDICNV